MQLVNKARIYCRPIRSALALLVSRVHLAPHVEDSPTPGKVAVLAAQPQAHPHLHLSGRHDAKCGPSERSEQSAEGAEH